MYLLTHERYKTYQTGYSFGHLGHAPGVGLGGTVGGSIFFSEIQPDFVCELHEWHMHRRQFWSPPLGEGPKGQILNFKYKVNFKDF